MKWLSLKAAVALSLACHAVFLSLIFITLKQNTSYMPGYSIVTIISEDTDLKETPLTEEKQTPETSLKDNAAIKALTNTPGPQYKDEAIENLGKKQVDRQYKEEKIAVMAAKKQVEQKVRARQEIQIGKQVSASRVSSYASKVKSTVRQQWVFPDVKDKTLETVVFVLVMKNGAVRIKNIQSSQNSEFDESVLKAIRKASPFEPPPHEMELSLRFKNED